MNQQQKEIFETQHLKYQMFIRKGQSKDITFSVQQQKTAILGVLRWLNNYDNMIQLSPIGKNPTVRIANDEYNTVASLKSVRLDCEGKIQFCRYYIQQDQVKGKTNLCEIHISTELDKLMQMNSNEKQKIQSQKWRGRVQNIFLEFRSYLDNKIINEHQTSPVVKISKKP